MSALAVSLIDKDEALRDLAGEWRELVIRSGHGLAMMAPEFMLPWLEATLENSRAQCNFLIVREGGRLVGVLPLVRRRIRRFGIVTDVLEFPMYGTTPPFDLLADHRPEPVLDALCEYLATHSKWDVLWLHQVSGDSPISTQLPASAARMGLQCRVLESGSLVYVPLAPSWPEFEQALGKKRRSNLRRLWRHLEEIGQPTLVSYPGRVGTLAQALEMATSVIDRSWKEPGQAREIQQRLLSNLAQQWDQCAGLSLRFLLMDGVPISYLLEVSHGKSTFAVSNAYDLTYRRLGPGHHVLGEAIRHAHEAGKSTYEFLGDKDYLERWAKEWHRFNSVCLAAPSMLSRIKAKIYLRARLRQVERARAKAEQTKESRKSSAVTIAPSAEERARDEAEP